MARLLEAIVVVRAPAGSGKSTLLELWSQKAAHPILRLAAGRGSFLRMARPGQGGPRSGVDSVSPTRLSPQATLLTTAR